MLVFDLPLCTLTGTEEKPRREQSGIYFKIYEKYTIFNEHPVYEPELRDEFNKFKLFELFRLELMGGRGYCHPFIVLYCNPILLRRNKSWAYAYTGVG